MSFLRKFLQGNQSAPKDSLIEKLNQFLSQKVGGSGWFSEEAIRSSHSFQELLSTSPEDQCKLLVLTLEGLSKSNGAASEAYNQLPSADRARILCARYLAMAFLRRKLPYSEAQFTQLISMIAELDEYHWADPRSFFPATVARYEKANDGFSEKQKKRLSALCAHWDKGSGDSPKWSRKIREIYAKEDDVPPLRIFRNSETFATKLLDDYERMPAQAQRAWTHLLAQAADCSPGKPSKKWEKLANERMRDVGEADFTERLIEWLPLVDQPATEVREHRYSATYTYRLDPMSICEPHLDTLKGLTWMAGQVDQDPLTRVLGQVGVSAYKKIPGIGPRAIKLGNACVWALGNIGSQCALSQLAMMKVRVKFGTAQKQIEKALQKLADSIGVSTDELEEMSVPHYGLTDVGRLEEKLGDFTAVLEVVGNKPVLSFLKPDGKPQKSVPAALKEQFSDDIKDIKGSAKDLEKMLMAQKERLDNLFLLQKSWTFSLWRERYLDHPVVGIFAVSLFGLLSVNPTKQPSTQFGIITRSVDSMERLLR